MRFKCKLKAQKNLVGIEIKRVSARVLEGGDLRVSYPLERQLLTHRRLGFKKMPFIFNLDVMDALKK